MIHNFRSLILSSLLIFWPACNCIVHISELHCSERCVNRHEPAVIAIIFVVDITVISEFKTEFPIVVFQSCTPTNRVIEEILIRL